LAYEIDSKQLTMSHLEHRSQDLASELHRIQDNYALLKTKYDALVREKDHLQVKLNQDI
jgi:chromosome segregation ATPase